MISFRSPQKISSYLVRAELYPLNCVLGSAKYGKKRCELCENIYETDTFTSTVTGETYRVKYRLNCDEKFLVYLLTCKLCGI